MPLRKGHGDCHPNGRGPKLPTWQLFNGIRKAATSVPNEPISGGRLAAQKPDDRGGLAQKEYNETHADRQDQAGGASKMPMHGLMTTLNWILARPLLGPTCPISNRIVPKVILGSVILAKLRQRDRHG